MTYTSPTAWSTVVGSPVTVTGTATDDISVEEFRLRVYSADLQYLQPDGSLSTNFYEFRFRP
ncbi:MAG: Ig-like domain-containing protein [Ilumatobacteraceae bacterium]